MTDDLATFPEPNLNGSAYPWARAVQARIADRERTASQHADRIKSLGQSLISLQHSALPRYDLAKAFKGDWVAPTPGSPAAAAWGPTYDFADGSLLPGMTISDPADVTVVGPGTPRQTAYPNATFPDSLCVGDSHTAYDSTLGYYPFVDAFADWPVSLPGVAGATVTYTLFAAYQTWDRPGQGNPSAGPWEVAVLVDGVKSDLSDTETGWSTLIADLGGPGSHTIEFRTYGTSAGAALYITDLRIIQTVTGGPTGGVEYLTGDLVRHDGKIWIATAGASGTAVDITDEPSATSTAWTLLADSGQGGGVDPDIYRPTGIQAGGSAGSGGTYFGIENHGYEAHQHSGIYLFEGYLDFTAVDENNGSNTEIVQDNGSFALTATDRAGSGHNLLELGLDPTTEVPYARILGVAVGGSSGEQHDFASAGQWTVNHSIGRIPSVTVYDAGGNLLLAEAAATSTQVVITFANPTAGTVVLT